MRFFGFCSSFSWSIQEGNLVLISSHIHREDQINAKVFSGGWKITFLLGRSLFWGYVKLREGICNL